MTHENMLGMFIHWGFYSLTGLQEQAFARYDMEREEYESLMHKFNPVDYDPEEWVRLARSCGMKYICFTTKHHDGFCMWDTKETDYNIMNTPYGKDVLKMLADACAKYGMKLSLYYSNPDWHCPFGYNPNSSHQWKAVNKDNPDIERYKQFVKAQITELLTNYGKIYSFFWDIPSGIEDPSMNELVRKLQPGIYINDRGWDKGDFSTPEREYEAAEGTRYTRMTEANNSFGQQSWGFRENEDFYSIRHIIQAIDRYMAMGASYLLNAGPDANGVIREDYASRFRAVGEWYDHMDGCLECHEADDFDYGPNPNKFIACKKDGKTYLHFYNGICSSAVNLRKYPNAPKRVWLMNTGDALDAEVCYLPECFNGKTGQAYAEVLHISGIPIDDLQSEAIVLEIEW